MGARCDEREEEEVKKHVRLYGLRLRTRVLSFQGKVPNGVGGLGLSRTQRRAMQRKMHVLLHDMLTTYNSDYSTDENTGKHACMHRFSTRLSTGNN